jgi:hypothetical protein
MSRKTDYIPANAGKFNDFLIKMCKYTSQRASGAGAVWKHIPKEDLDALNNGYFAWGTAYGGFLEDPHRPSKIQARRDAQKIAVSLVRDFVNRFLRHAPVTDEDRVEMGIPVRDKTKTPSGIPQEEVEFYLKPKGEQKIKVYFKVLGADGKAKPHGYNGAFVAWAVLDNPPALYSELTNHALASRRPFTLEFTRDQRKKEVYVALCWQNGSGKNGAYSAIQSSVIT